MGRMRYNVPMRVISLQSGSNGNCIYVEADGVKLLFDAGISASMSRSGSPCMAGMQLRSMRSSFPTIILTIAAAWES